MVELALLRHGPTGWNADHRFQGRVEQPLSQAGRAVVAQFRLPADVLGFQRLVSPQLRARQTAHLLFGPGTPVEPRLREINFGGWEGYTVKDLEDRWGDLFKQLEARGVDFRPPGGESIAEIKLRLRPLLKQVADGGEPVLAVSHRKTIQSLLSLATGWDTFSDHHLGQPVKMKFPRLHRFDIAPDGTPSVLSLNEKILP